MGTDFYAFSPKGDFGWYFAIARDWIGSGRGMTRGIAARGGVRSCIIDAWRSSR